MKEKQKSIIERYLLTHKIMAGVEAFFTFVISIVTMIITTGLFIKILILKDGDKVDFFLIYNILSFERTVENVHGLLFEFLNNLKYLGYCEELMIVPPEEGYDFVLKDGSYVFKDRVPSEWIKEGKIEFEKYSVKYRPELETVLKDLTLSIKPN
jgi:ABC-type multidrug transport system fused ATPase/permease subunit